MTRDNAIVLGLLALVVGTCAVTGQRGAPDRLPAKITDTEACDIYLGWCSEFVEGSGRLLTMRQRQDAMAPAERRDTAAEFGREAAQLRVTLPPLQRKITEAERLVPARCVDTCKRMLATLAE